MPSDLDLQREAEEGTDEDDRAENSHTDESGLGRNRSNDVTGDEEFQSEKNGSPKHSAKLPVHVVLAPNDSSDSGRSRDRSSNHDHCNTYTVDGHPYVLDNIAVAHLAPFVGATLMAMYRLENDTLLVTWGAPGKADAPSAFDARGAARTEFKRN